MTTTDRTDDAKKKGAKKKLGAGATIIHVAFGPGGGRIPDAQTMAARTRTIEEATAPLLGVGGREPVTDLFTRREVAKLLNVPETKLKSLDKAKVVSPSGSRQGKRAYTFQDLIALRATRELLAHNVKLRDVAQAIGALRRTLPRVTRPLQELRIVSDGRRVVVRADGGAFEAVSGQMVMDFQVGALREDVVRVLRPQTPAARAAKAYELYTQASSLDEKPETFAEAEALYAKAIEIDPSLAIAYTNLGNIRFRRGDDKGAEQLYRQAIEIDGAQPEAHYNLGYVMLERGSAKEAIGYFVRALESDPRFADAHFNLAMAYEQSGDRNKARPHWKRYLELEPTGTWADIARQHL
jgi:Flp pilus assembly protein TadD/DNA-binding transcriptional MerR regulator